MPPLPRTYSLDIKKRFVIAIEAITKEVYPIKKEVDIVKSVGFSPSNYYRMRIVDNSYPTLDHCAAICELYNISETWLLTGKGNIYKLNEGESNISILKKAVSAIEIELQLSNSKLNPG